LGADQDRVGIAELAGPPDDGDLVPLELVGDDVDLARDHLADPRQQLLGGRAGPGRRRAAAVRPAQRPDRLPERLAGNGPGLDGDAPDDPLALDHRRALAELGRLDGGPLAGRAAPDRDQVEVVGLGHTPALYREATAARPGSRRARTGVGRPGAGAPPGAPRPGAGAAAPRAGRLPRLTQSEGLRSGVQVRRRGTRRPRAGRRSSRTPARSGSPRSRPGPRPRAGDHSPGVAAPRPRASGLSAHGPARAESQRVTPAFCQSSRKRLSPASVSGCLRSCWNTVYGSVATSAPARAASTTCSGLRSDAASTCVSNS